MRRISTGLALFIALLVLPAATAAAADPDTFSTHLTGENEIPARTTPAQGQAILMVVDGGEAVAFRLIASNISNVVAAHIHQGPPTQNGPVVAFLYGAVPAGGGRHDGVLSTGIIAADDLLGPLAGHPIGDLIALMRSGNAYVNVYTNDGVGAVNTGPGDFPGGEIRGQV